MILEDYKIIKELIDEMVGINTKQGENLKLAIKNYFESQPIKVKLVTEISENKTFQGHYNANNDNDAQLAIDKYTKKLRDDINQLKKKGQFCGISS